LQRTAHRAAAERQYVSQNNVTINIQTVTACIEEAAHTLALPRFSRLSADEVEAKATAGDPEDVVTIVDREVEAYLSKASQP
jgi:fructose-1,6-bisphosphatase/inositol monophosphatase family enzyme